MTVEAEVGVGWSSDPRLLCNVRDFSTQELVCNFCVLFVHAVASGKLIRRDCIKVGRISEASFPSLVLFLAVSNITRTHGLPRGVIICFVPILSC